MLITAALVVAALPMVAQSAIVNAAATGKASVSILPADITISHVEGAFLNFGIIQAGPAAKTVAIATRQGAPVGGVGAKGADHFTFTKDKNETASVHRDDTVTLSSLTNPTDHLTVTLDSAVPGGMYSGYEGSNATSRGGGNTSGEIWVGGTLTIPAWTPKGDYTGTYQVTIQYVM
jgi:hypothetical protein